MPPNQSFHSALDQLIVEEQVDVRKIRVALLGCGMMGQEHVSYMSGFPSEVRIDFLCDPHEPSLHKSLQVLQEFGSHVDRLPLLLTTEDDLLAHVNDIDLLVIASPNYLHTDTILRWATHDVTILVEKPVCVNQAQLDRLNELLASGPNLNVARIWVAMEYRFMPAISKLVSLLPSIGDVKMVTIRENRFPFLHKVGAWNRDREKTGDTLVEKCVHFFDLFRLVTGAEANLASVRALAQRSINYDDEPEAPSGPIMDSAYVTMPFGTPSGPILTCLELCMYAEGSRHQEEVIVTGTKGRLEAYLPENKVFHFERPSPSEWPDRSVPPPAKSIRQHVYDCNISLVETDPITGAKLKAPTHPGYHYGSTAVEWLKLVQAMHIYQATGVWNPAVSLKDGIQAVELGLTATRALLEE